VRSSGWATTAGLDVGNHLHAIFGDPHQPIFRRLDAAVRLGKWPTTAGHSGAAGRCQHLPPNPGLTAKEAVNASNHVSEGRARSWASAGPGSSSEHDAYGHRLRHGPSDSVSTGWTRPSRPAGWCSMAARSRPKPGRLLLVSMSFDSLPLPVQQHLPIMIGGSGEKKTLRTIAKYADMWKRGWGPVDVMRHKIEVLRGHCDAVGRDISEVEFTLGAKARHPRLAGGGRAVSGGPTWSTTRRQWPTSRTTSRFWNGSPEQIAERLAPYVELGFHHLLVEMPAPFDREGTLGADFIGEVKPLIERG